METYRNELELNTIYFESSSDQYYVTTDGVGCFWYDTYEEAVDQHGITGDIIEIEKLSDFE